MSYNVESKPKLKALKDLAEKVKQDYATKQSVTALSDRVDELVTAGGEPNKIESVKVNGTAQAITDKAVDITVPVKVSDLTNDSKYQTETEVAAAIAASGHAKFAKVDAVPEATDAEENVLYLVKNTKTKHYDIYALVGESMELLDDTTVDLTGYVEKEDGKGLSANDFTDAEKEKLAGLENYSHPTHEVKPSGLYKVTVDGEGHVSAAVAVEKADITGLGIPAQDTTYTVATSTADGLMSAADKEKLDGIEFATDAEVAEMLDEIFGA